MKLCVSIGLLILLKTCILPINITINLSIKTNYVKRAVGIAGDTLEVINGYVYINGEKINYQKGQSCNFHIWFNLKRISSIKRL
ncbi:MAG: hypothetical protein CM15mP36_12020 [Flavobacteriales bacterium]|nr:MAG: hypothetical protein CM15mP36_12020 [Flavobacteriales bacterium]